MNSFNTPTFVNYSVTAPGTAERLPAYYLRDGAEVTLTNRRASTGNFYLGATKAAAEGGDRKVIIPGQSISMRITNPAAIWADADSANDVLEVVFGDGTSGSNPG